MNPWKTLGFSGLLLGCLAVSANEQLSEVQAMIKTDPEQGLIEAQNLWQGRPVNADNIALGLLLINALKAEKQFDQAKSLLSGFQGLSDLTPAQQGLLLAEQLILFRESKSTEDLTPVIESAESLLQQLSQQNQTAEVQKALYELNRSIGFKYYFEGSFAAAEPYFFAALDLSDSSDHQIISDTLNTLGVIKAQQADLAGGAEYMLKSIRVLEENNLPIAAMRYQNLGSLNFMLKNWDKTIEFSQQALDLQTTENKITASLYSNMAAAYVEKEAFKAAIELLHKSIAINTRLNESTANARNNLAYIYNQSGEYEQALQQLETTKAELILADQEEQLSTTYKSMGDVYANMQDYAQAIALYDQAYELHKEHDFKMKRVELYPKMIEVLVKGDNFQRAYAMMVEFKALNDEIIDVESTQKVNELLAAYDLEKKERALIDSELERTKQQKNIAVLKSQTDFNNKMRNLMLLLLLGLVVILALIYRSWRFRGRVNQLLLDKNQSIEQQHNQLKSLNNQLKTQAEIDTLTGLKNRRYLTQLIASESAKNKTVQKKWCLVIIDLDDFKDINDQFGHQRGDEVLVQFAQCLDQHKATNDVVARWGGEEFLWLAEMSTVMEGAQKCTDFQTVLSNQAWFRGHEKAVTCSMGFSSFPLVDLSFEDWEAALKLADYALYQAKNAGKNQWFGFRLLDAHLSYTEINDVESLLLGKRLQLLKK